MNKTRLSCNFAVSLIALLVCGVFLMLIFPSRQQKTASELRQDNIRHIKNHHFLAVQIASALAEHKESGGSPPTSLVEAQNTVGDYLVPAEDLFSDDNDPLWMWVNDGRYLILSREMYVIDGEEFKIGITNQYIVDPLHISWSGERK